MPPCTLLEFSQHRVVSSVPLFEMAVGSLESLILEWHSLVDVGILKIMTAFHEGIGGVVALLAGTR